MRDTTEIPVFADTNLSDTWPADTDSVPGNGAGVSHGVYLHRVAFDRYPSTTVNLSDVDGHAETIPVAALWSQKWNKLFDTDTQVTINW